MCVFLCEIFFIFIKYARYFLYFFNVSVSNASVILKLDIISNFNFEICFFFFISSYISYNKTQKKKKKN